MTKHKLCIILLMSAFIVSTTFKVVNPPPQKDGGKLHIHYAILKYKNKPLLLKMIKEESSFNRFAVSKKGALGLMQVMPNIWGNKLKDLGIIKDMGDLFKVEENIASGYYILTYYKSKSKTWKQAIKKYRGIKNEKG